MGLTGCLMLYGLNFKKEEIFQMKLESDIKDKSCA